MMAVCTFLIITIEIQESVVVPIQKMLLLSPKLTGLVLKLNTNIKENHRI